jgi:hypothetical protein
MIKITHPSFWTRIGIPLSTLKLLRRSPHLTVGAAFMTLDRSYINIIHVGRLDLSFYKNKDNRFNEIREAPFAEGVLDESY